jgi:hypothetical protein
MRQFYTMHENIYLEIKSCKKINKISLLTENMQTKQNTIIRQKKSLVMQPYYSIVSPTFN